MKRKLSTLLLALALFVSLGVTAQAADVSGYEQQVVSLVNAERARYSLPALTLRSDLCAYARVKSDDLRTGGYFSHEPHLRLAVFHDAVVRRVVYIRRGEHRHGL